VAVKAVARVCGRPAGTARMIANYDVAQFFADLTDPDPET
jgi:hypothetical protein